MRTQIEQSLLKIFQTLRQTADCAVVSAVWMYLRRRENERLYQNSLVSWAEAKAQVQAEMDRPLWVAPEMDEVSKMRARKMVDLMVAEMEQERELASLKEQALESGSHLEQTVAVA